jgi:hypothetical protein
MSEIADQGPRSQLPAAGLTTTNDSRAAVVCFGAWGLQTMLHAWPRLRLLQEERQALGVAASLPDLDRLVSFATIVPAFGAAGSPGATVVRPAHDRYPYPGYLETLVRQPGPPESRVPGVTQSETPAASWLQRGLADGYLHALPLAGARGAGRVTTGLASGAARAATYNVGLSLAPAIVSALVGDVIDPTRLDGRQTRDPFVQTTVYVVASLAEAHAAAFVWPVVSELVKVLGDRHIARVVGLFGTGSFARGSDRLLEEAAVYAGLRELEALVRAAETPAAATVWQQLLGVAPEEVIEEALPGPLFDRIYLIDREKSNQSLAQTPQELAVLVGNALEAFLVAGGADLVEDRLIHDSLTGPVFPYSVLGTAGDYLPLADYLAAAIAAEQQQIIRSEVLVAPVHTPPVPAPVPAAPPIDPGAAPSSDPTGTLAEIGAAPADAFASAMAAGGAAAFDSPSALATAATSGRDSALVPVPRDLPATWTDELRVARDFLLSASVARQLAQAPSLAEWRRMADARMAEAEAEIDALCDAAEAAWGLPAPAQSEEAGTLPVATSSADSLFARTHRAAVARLAAIICSNPSGLLAARAHAGQWLAEAEAALDELARTQSPSERDDNYRRGMALVQRAWAAASAHSRPIWLWTAGGAAVGLACAVVFLASLVMGNGMRLAGWPILGTLLTIVGLAAIGAWVGWANATGPARRLKEDWLALADAHLAWRARRRLHADLLRLYRVVYADLESLGACLSGARDELAAWSAGSGSPTRMLPDVSSTHLRLAHGSDRLWRAAQAQIAQAAAAGETGRSEFRRVWRGHAHAVPGMEASDLSSQVAAILGEPNSRRAQDQASVGAAAKALAGLYREYAVVATAYLRPQQKLLAGYSGLVQQVARDANIEQLLFGDPEGQPAGPGALTPLTFLEDVYARAKPAANYEITSRLSPDAGDVEFVVTPAGSRSRLAHAAEQRGMVLLVSHDPLSITVVRVLGSLALEDLALAGRCRRSYQRLSPEERSRLSLLPDAESGVVVALYGAVPAEI